MSEDEADVGYKSAMDMPSFAELMEKARGAMASRFLMDTKSRADVERMYQEMIDLGNDVERFYDLLGDRHWIFHDRIPTTLVRENILGATDADAAEQALCDYYEDPEQMRFLVMPFMRFPEMRARQHLVDFARRDFEEKRYYAVVLNLLTVMDGFVNDVQTVRRGLHAREPEELQSWDTPVGHHKGLTATQPSFRRSFFKRSDDEVFDLFRNGILHGNLPNYDNRIVACKAWNRLLAVSDWAWSLEQQAKPKKPKPTWGDTVQLLKQNAENRKAQDSWTAASGTVAPGEAEHSSIRAAADFLDLWVKKNWGHLAGCFMLIGTAATPAEVRSWFAPYVIESYRLVSWETQAPAIAEVEVELVLKGTTFPATLRMTFTSDNGDVRVEGQQDGSWKVVHRNPALYNRDLGTAADWG